MLTASIGLTYTETESLQKSIRQNVAKFFASTMKAPPSIKFYESVYTTLSNPRNEDKLIDQFANMVNYRKQELDCLLLKPSSIPSTKWGLDGHLLSKLTDFEKSFSDYFSRTTINGETQHRSNCLVNHDSFPANGKCSDDSNFHIVFLSPEDGKSATARMTQLLAKGVLQKKFSSDDVDAATVHAILSNHESVPWPSMDLILNFNDTPTVAGFPAWQLRYAEIVNAGRLHESLPKVWHQFDVALQTFSKTVQRFGK